MDVWKSCARATRASKVDDYLSARWWWCCCCCCGGGYDTNAKLPTWSLWFVRIGFPYRVCFPTLRDDSPRDILWLRCDRCDWFVEMCWFRCEWCFRIVIYSNEIKRVDGILLNNSIYLSLMRCFVKWFDKILCGLIVKSPISSCALLQNDTWQFSGRRITNKK